MTRLSSVAMLAVFGSVLTTIVAAAMGTILLFTTPGTVTPRLTIGVEPVAGIGGFLVTAVAGVLVIVLAAATRGETA